MFGMGLTIKLDDFKIVFTRPKELLIGCFAQFTIMPLVAFCLAKAFHLSPDLAIGVIFVAHENVGGKQKAIIDNTIIIIPIYLDAKLLILAILFIISPQN